MQQLRLWTRALGLFFWTIALFSIRLAIYPLRKHDEPRDRRWRRFWFALWGRGFARIFGVRIVVKGKPPAPPFYIVCNHLSYLDVLLMVSQTGCGFVARGDIEHWPVLGYMCKKLDVLFIDRTNKRDTVRINELIARTIAQGDGMCVFPESRIFCGRDVEPFKSSLIEPAIKIGMPIHYATVTYKTHPGAPPASTIVSWWRPEPFFFHVARQLRHPGCTATIIFGAAPIHGSDRKQLAHDLSEAVRANFTPLAYAPEGNT
jgi:1-acyl-sn-glycerol-3-phosphate acyltransferase